MMTVRRIPENHPRIRAFVLLRYTLIIATAYLLLVEHKFSSLPSGLILLIVVALTSNVLMMRLPARITDSTAFNATVIIADTVWITAALLYSGLFKADFFYVYFFVLLLAAIGENLFSIVVGAIVTCTAYLYILSNTTTSLPVWSSSSLIRIPFLFTAAGFYGYLVDRVRREQQRARAEADTVALLEHEISDRKQAESSLRESEERYRNLVEFFPDAIVVHSEGTITYVNPAGGRLLGAGDPEQLIGTPVMDIVHPDYREAAKERIQQTIAEGTLLPLTEEKITRLDGTEVDIEVTAVPLTYHENSGVLTVIRDITERKQAEAALQAAKDYAENLIDSSLDMIISADVNRNIVEFNQAAQHAFGYSKAEVLGRPIDLLYADPPEGSRVNASMLEYGSFTGEVTNKRKNGEIFCAYLSGSVMRDANGRVVGGMGISRDITERVTHHRAQTGRGGVAGGEGLCREPYRQLFRHDHLRRREPEYRGVQPSSSTCLRIQQSGSLRQAH